MIQLTVCEGATMLVCANHDDTRSSPKTRVRCFAAPFELAAVRRGWRHCDRGRLDVILSVRLRDGLALLAGWSCVFRRCNVCRIPVRLTLGVSQRPASTVGRNRLRVPRKHTRARNSFERVVYSCWLAADTLVSCESGRHSDYVSMEFRNPLLSDI